MAWFKFRLQASLSLAEKALEEAQRRLAEEIILWQKLIDKRDRLEESRQAALEGQRSTGLTHPEELGRWQAFAWEQYLKLQTCETELSAQEERTEEKRGLVLEAYREKEKFLRLRSRQAQAFALAEQRKEQKVLDETAQVVYMRQTRRRD